MPLEDVRWLRAQWLLSRTLNALALKVRGVFMCVCVCFCGCVCAVLCCVCDSVTEH